MNYTYVELAKMIDHSLLHPTMTDRELEDGCRLAAQYQVASVCLKPYGASRCGATATAAILDEFIRRENAPASAGTMGAGGI